MHQQYAEQIRSSVFCFFFRVKEQSNTTAKRSETNMLFWHICHLRGLGRTPPAGSDDVCVCVCAMVWLMAYHTCQLCIFSALSTCRSPAYGSKTRWLVCHVCSVCVPHPCVKSWAVSGAIVPGALVGDRCLQASMALLDSLADQRLYWSQSPDSIEHD